MTSIRRLRPILVAFLCVAPAITQSTAAPPQKSDRESAGLRGPVEECSSKRTIPPHHPGDRTLTDFYASKYNRDGSIYQVTDDEGSESVVYDGQGRELADVWEGGRWPATIYTYDAQARLIAIDGAVGLTTKFEYDDQGHKTRTMKSDANASSSPSSYLYDFGADEDEPVFPSEGGLVRTSFNEHDQAIESLVYDSDGDLTTRWSSTYDAKGRVAELLEVMTKWEYLRSAEGRARLAADPASYGEMSEPAFQASYVYDDENRLIEERDYYVTSQETTLTKIAYNDHGDQIEKVKTTYHGPLSAPRGGGASETPVEVSDSRLAAPELDVSQFSYQYDSFGNWIEETVSSPATEHEPSITWSVTRRTITYY